MIETLLKKAQFFLQTDGSSSASTLQMIFAKVKELTTINQHLHPFLDTRIRAYCYATTMTKNRLILVVANGSIATHIRLHSMQLLQQFKRDSVLKNIREIHCKVSPSLFIKKESKARKKMALLSSQNATMLKDMALLLEDPKLREIMLRIANRKQ